MMIKAIATAAAILTLSACTLPFTKPETAGEMPPAATAPQSSSNAASTGGGPRTFKDISELNAYLAAVALNGGGYADYRGIGAMKTMSPLAVEDMAAGDGFAAPTANAADQPPDHSRTNVQVEGADEADIIKTDGRYIYALAKDTVLIIDAQDPDKAAVLARIKFASRPSDMYLSAGRLVVFGQKEYRRAPAPVMEQTLVPEIWDYRPVSYFKVFDLADPKSPREVRSLEFDGNYSDSRLIGGYVYYIVNNWNYQAIGDWPIPRIMSGEKPAELRCGAEKCLMPPVRYFDLPWQQPNFVTIAAINIADENEAIASEIYLVESGNTTYASLDNLYLVSTEYRSEDELYGEVLKKVMLGRLSAEEKGRIEKIDAVDDLILSPAEKTAKIRQALEYFLRARNEDERAAIAKAVGTAFEAAYPDLGSVLVRTVIHKISIAQGKIAYQARGEAPGTVLNQFSLDEYGGNLRLATTRQPAWSRFGDGSRESKSTNNVYVLGRDLELIGRLEGLAPGEQIYSARFLGPRLYLVTYERTDPLFTIDLSVPAAPKVLGELKIPGFSNYLHPYGDDLLLGIGKDTSDQDGRVLTKGLKVSLFDVSDVASPREVDTLVLGGQGSDSAALSDHKAVLFSRDRELLVIPVSLRDGWDRLEFSGAAVIKAASTSLELSGRIDHSDGGKPSGADDWQGYGYYDNSVKRSLYIGDRLFTFSNNYLRSNRMPGLESVQTLDLRETGDDYQVIN